MDPGLRRDGANGKGPVTSDRLAQRRASLSQSDGETGWRPSCPPSRRAAIAAGVGLLAAPRLALADEEDAKRERPQTGDVLVKIGAVDTAPLKAADLPLGGPQVLAWPMDPASKTVRDGSRLNKVLLLRLDPAGFDTATKARAADGVVAYSAICPHTGCEVALWLAATQRLECPCHFSQYDPKIGAAVVGGPTPRPLPALPLKTADGRLVVAKPFTGRPGFQQT
ncbi:MAG: Rieske (2Fe-2S) protein [Alphaproteobacteria bacterium]|nr:Rieske (2Fe-2S) protein [Alphaproteobacteria bacterium]